MVYPTSRRRPLPDDQAVHLDFLNAGDFRAPTGVGSAVIVGGPVSYAECENDFDRVFKVNCEAVPELAVRLMRAGLFVVYLSTNTVFNRMTPQSENAEVNPVIAYSRVKAAAEQAIRKLAIEAKCEERFAILRLTKNVGPTVDPFGAWRTAIAQRTEFNTLSDLYFAPVRYLDLAIAVERVLEARNAGIYHLSGERDVDYHEFAAGLLKHLGLPSRLARRVSSTEIGVKLSYNHPCTALSMAATTRQLGLKPVSLQSVYADLGAGLA